MSGLVNKVKDALSGENNAPAAHAVNQGASDYSPSTGLASGTFIRQSSIVCSLTVLILSVGTHHGSATGAHHDSTIPSTGLTSSSDNTSSTTTAGHAYGSTNVGPHSSSLANKADPRVDSDLDGRGVSSGATSGMTGTGTTGHSYGSTNVGPRSSSLANKADPRVDSNLDGRGVSSGATSGMTTGVVGGAPAHHGHGHAHGNEDIVHGGAHHSQTANRLDPNVTSSTTDSGLGSSTVEGSGYGSTTTGNYGSSTTGATTAGTTTGGSTGNTTAGPHKSAMLNKLDPR